MKSRGGRQEKKFVDGVCLRERDRERERKSLCLCIICRRCTCLCKSGLLCTSPLQVSFHECRSLLQVSFADLFSYVDAAHICVFSLRRVMCVLVYVSGFLSVPAPIPAPLPRGGGLGSRPKKMYWEYLGDGVEYHLMSPTPRR